jgi:hypothetical protein
MRRNMIRITIAIIMIAWTITTTRLVLVVANAMEQSPSTTGINAPNQHKMRQLGVGPTTTVDCHAFAPIIIDPTTNPPPVRRDEKTTSGGRAQGRLNTHNINAERRCGRKNTTTTGLFAKRRPIIAGMVAAVNQYQLPAIVLTTLRGGTSATTTATTTLAKKRRTAITTAQNGTITTDDGRDSSGSSRSRHWFGRVMFWSLGPAIVIMPFWMLLGRTLMGGPGGWMTLLLMKYVCPVMFFYHIVLWYVLFGVIVDRRTATTIRDFGVSDRFGFVLLGYYATAFCQQVFMSDWGDEELIMPSVAEAFLGINAKWCDHIHALLFLSLPLWMFLMLIMACYDRDEEPTGVSVPSSVHSA